MDEKYLEMAGDLSAAEVSFGISQARKTQPKPEGFDGTCGTCGEEIPPARIEHGFYNCVHCATLAEKQQRRR